MYNSRLPLVSIVDYGMGNLFSVVRACEFGGFKATITSKKEDIINSDAAILPGVGAFGDAMANLANLGLINPLRDFIKNGKPFMGICLGMQLLFTESEEFGRHKGLDIIHGRVLKFSVKDEHGNTNKVPQVGWNSIHRPVYTSESSWSDSPLEGIHNGDFMYFVHSYYCQPEDNKMVLSLTKYAGIEYCSSILWKNIFATQFHPEKSAWKGKCIYKKWAEKIKGHGRD